MSKFALRQSFLYRSMQESKLIPHLFRTEFRKITAVLCRTFGIDHIQEAEDIASETFLQAMETWPYNGVPENPTAWLYSVAKNKARNYLARTKIFSEKIAVALKRESPRKTEAEIDLSSQNIADSQLQMLFAVCHPTLSVEAQIALSLRILCGFGIEEIADAFLTSKDTINKRLFRAKEKLRQEKVEIVSAEVWTQNGDEFHRRLDTVLATLYLLFSEGYFSESQDTVLREDLCLEAMRLCRLLLDYETSNLPKVKALMALMCFHASRFPARKNEHGELLLYHEQNENLWNTELIDQGIYFLKEASQGNALSKYHLEASIAYWHTIKEDTAEKWESILHLYNLLLQVEYSPVAALNRTFALSKARGKEPAIREAEKLKLTNNQYYFTLLGELNKDLDNAKARRYFEKALSLAKTKYDKQTLRKKIEATRALM